MADPIFDKNSNKDTSKPTDPMFNKSSNEQAKGQVGGNDRKPEQGGIDNSRAEGDAKEKGAIGGLNEKKPETGQQSGSQDKARVEPTGSNQR